MKINLKRIFLKHTEFAPLIILVFSLIFFLARLRKEKLLSAEDYIPEVPKVKISEMEFSKGHQELVKKALNEFKSFEESDYKRKMLERNLYDYRDVIKREAIERDIVDKLKVANSLFDQGLFEEVVKITEDILKKDPNREPAKMLLKKAKEALKSP